MYFRNSINPETSFPLSDLMQGQGIRIVKNVLTNDDIERVHEIATWYPKTTGTVGSEQPGTVNNEEVNSKVRTSNVTFIKPDAKTNWLFDKLGQFSVFHNAVFYRYNLGFIETIQYTEYEIGGHYNYHYDSFDREYNVFFEQRKLSVTIQLSDPEDYEGGDLEFYNPKEPISVPREKGAGILFPSYMYHRVTPVTKGKRYSLVFWLTGPEWV